MRGNGFDAILNTAAIGDPAERERAFTELLRFVRIVVRAEMGQRLRDHRESIDVCQSIAKSFVDDLQTGRIAFDNEHALAAFLRLAVRNKLADLSRRDNARKRNSNSRTRSLEQTPEPAEITETPRADEWPRIRDRLNEHDRRLVELQMRGLSWERIGQELDLNPATARMQFSRLIRRLRKQETDSQD